MPSLLVSSLLHAATVSAALTYTLNKAANPSADELDAYTRIEAAMDKAVARHARFSDITKAFTVNYDPGTPTADGNYNGNLNYGADRAFMQERTALHEIAHGLGVGQTSYFDTNCADNGWTSATQLLHTFDGPSASISCGGGHFWPYGLNYDDEWSETNGDRHVQMILALITDGMQGPGVEIPPAKADGAAAATTTTTTTTTTITTTTTTTTTTSSSTPSVDSPSTPAAVAYSPAPPASLPSPPPALPPPPSNGTTSAGPTKKPKSGKGLPTKRPRPHRRPMPQGPAGYQGQAGSQGPAGPESGWRSRGPAGYRGQAEPQSPAASGEGQGRTNDRFSK